MSGFFTQEEIPTNTKINAPTCARCGLSVRCTTPKMKPSGKGKKGLYILGDSPSQTDDAKGKHFAGTSGKYLRSILRKNDVLMSEDCVTDYALSCRPNKSAPTGVQLQACRSYTLRSIAEHKPKVILVLGNNGIDTLLAHRITKNLGGTTKWRGFAVPDREFNAWVVYTYTPAFIMQGKKKDPVLNKIFNDDIRLAISHLDVPFPEYKDERQCVKILATEDEQVAWMKDVVKQASDRPLLLALDYETTGLKPQTKGHAIACVSMCCKDDEAVAFMFPLGSIAARWFKRIMQHSNIYKTAHNIKYEQLWTMVILGYPITPWLWCSMQGAHILDNRPGIAGLKFQTFINFGLTGYDDVIAPYLKSDDEKNANAFNRVFEAPRAELLLYNGIDALVNYKMALKQMEVVGYGEDITKHC